MGAPSTGLRPRFCFKCRANVRKRIMGEGGHKYCDDCYTAQKTNIPPMDAIAHAHANETGPNPHPRETCGVCKQAAGILSTPQPKTISEASALLQSGAVVIIPEVPDASGPVSLPIIKEDGRLWYVDMRLKEKRDFYTAAPDRFDSGGLAEEYYKNILSHQPKISIIDVDGPDGEGVKMED